MKPKEPVKIVQVSSGLKNVVHEVQHDSETNTVKVTSYSTDSNGTPNGYIGQSSGSR